MEDCSKINNNTTIEKAPKPTNDIKIKKTFKITEDVIEDCLSTCL
ncbi:hypothetical protein [Clostridium sp. JNZ J1-5]|nr:hypothetical protein [Clostridium sp.]